MIDQAVDIGEGLCPLGDLVRVVKCKSFKIRCIITDNDHCSRVGRECDIDCIAGNIVHNVDQANIGGIAVYCIDRSRLILRAAVFELNGSILRIGQALVCEHHSDLTVVLTADRRIGGSKRHIICHSRNERIAEMTAVSVIVGIQLHAGEDIVAAAPERCKINICICIAAERFCLCDRTADLIITAEVVFRNGELRAGIIGINGILDRRQDRDILLTPLSDPAILHKALFIERADRLQSVLCAVSAGFGVVVDIQHIEQPHTGFIACLLHIIEILVDIPVIFPVGVGSVPVITVSKMIVCRVAVERRSEDLCFRVNGFDRFGKLDGLFGQLGHCDGVGVHTTVCMLPECRLVIKAIALNTGRTACITERIDDVIDILVHVYGSVRQIGGHGESTALCEFHRIPAAGGCCFRFRYAAVLIGCHIACHLQRR